MKEQDLYEIIGTSKQAVKFTIEGKARTEKEQDLFIEKRQNILLNY